MTRLVAWLGGGAGWLLAIGIAVWAIGAVGRGRQREADLYKTTVHAFEELNDSLAATRKRNEVLIKRRLIIGRAASLNKATVDSILRAHPVVTAPASCAPWTRALTACQAEAMNLRQSLVLADSIHHADSTALALVGPVLDSGVTALQKKQNKWLFGLLPKPVLTLGVGVVSSAITRPGLTLSIGIPLN